MPTCPMCAEDVEPGTTICPHCESALAVATPTIKLPAVVTPPPAVVAAAVPPPPRRVVVPTAVKPPVAPVVAVIAASLVVVVVAVGLSLRKAPVDAVSAGAAVATAESPALLEPVSVPSLPAAGPPTPVPVPPAPMPTAPEDAGGGEPVVLEEHDVEGTVESITEGDRSHLTLATATERSLDLIIATDLPKDEKALIGKKVRVRYVKQRMWIPEGGVFETMLMMTTLVVDSASQGVDDAGIPPTPEASRLFITVSSANLRTAPNRTADLVAKLRIGTACTKMTTAGEWVELSCDGGVRGYCRADLLSAEMPTIDSVLKELATATEPNARFNVYVRALTLVPSKTDLIAHARRAYFDSQFALLADIHANPKRRSPRRVEAACAAADDTCIRMALGMRVDAFVERQGDFFDVIELREGDVKAQEYMGTIAGGAFLVDTEIPYRDPPEAFSVIFGGTR